MDPELNEIFQPEIRIKKLKLENFRGFDQLELEFHQDLTVLIGDNGAGKTAILDCLAIFLNIFLEMLTQAENLEQFKFENKDLEKYINLSDIGAKSNFHSESKLRIQCTLLFGKSEISWDINFDGRFDKQHSIEVLSSPLIKEFREKIFRAGKKIPYPRLNVPIIVYYSMSTVASINFVDFKNARSDFSTDKISNIYDHALDKKSLDFTCFFEWYRWHKQIDEHNLELEPANRAIGNLLGDKDNPFPQLYFDRYRPSGEMSIFSKGTGVNVNLLSSGEKTLLALAADLARRLTIANPLRNPLLADEDILSIDQIKQQLTGYGIVLIDEIELHLHPRWQRDIIPRLRKTFPNCQFIVTTHSPLALSQVKPENVVILENSQVVKNTPHTFGRDNNSILYELMNVKQRPDDTQKQLDKFYELLDDGNKVAAQELLKQLSQDLGEDDTAIVRAYHHLAFMDDTNETN